MVLLNKCCCFIGLAKGGLILGWLGAVESFFVIILSIIGLSNVETIMNHLRNETESYTAQAVNETHLSLFRRHHGEMSLDDMRIIERGELDFEHCKLISYITIYFMFPLSLYDHRHVYDFHFKLTRQCGHARVIASIDNRSSQGTSRTLLP